MYRNYLSIVISFVFILTINFTGPVLAEENGTGSVFDSLPANNPAQNDEQGKPTTVTESEPVTTEDNSVLETAETPFDSGTSFFMLFMQMIAALAVVIALIYIMLRFVGKRTRSFRDHQTLQSIGGVPLGANRSLQMIKLGDRILVVGVGETIQLIKEIDDETEVAKIMEQHQSEFDRLEEPLTKASTWINQLVTKKNQENTKKTLDFSELLDKQLQDVSKSQQQIREAMKEHKK
ncbi:flagellar biosynthetic protein FliO [Alkalihalobacterium chitinilyticum]|uniref:Flagellar biosynthetic protein FliO n=1 Tax=Alkalihalobacterium chitinilyticum TaxID=2980103 RepID=A0ABT5VBW3_9BACI|nr:flagellar biosynthetic protein FliO [Alkalihalobacterium chitinilyticum]MDE5412954.1 flagellar biosynthetic protein FliO [Alkalihalobacterium chitinilyticum]